MIYVVATYMGWRARELASLTPESFNLDEQAVTTLAAYSKHRREDELPIHSELVKQLRIWTRDKPKGQPLWPGHWAQHRHGAEMLRVDLKAAGIPYKDERGRVFDFHALRGQFVTSLALVGVSLVKSQKLARHSTPNLTANVYTKPELDDLRVEVEKLPPPPSVVRSTENTPLTLRLTLPATTPVQSGSPEVTERKPAGDRDTVPQETPKPLVASAVSTAGHQGSASITQVPEVGLEPTPSCEDWILSPARLPFRHSGMIVVLQ
jgi:hypothetical protein